MGLGTRAWARTVRPYFSFLEAEGFRLDAALAGTSNWSTDALYRSPLGAVRVDRNFEVQRVQVELIRLVDGGLPERDAFFDPAAPLHHTLLDNVVEARAPGLLPELESAGGLNRIEIKDALALNAELLRSVAPDFLDGGSDVFVDAKSVIAERVKQNPQRITIWVSETADDDEVQKARTSATKEAPDFVEIVVRRYRAGPGRSRRWKSWLRLRD